MHAFADQFTAEVQNTFASKVARGRVSSDRIEERPGSVSGRHGYRPAAFTIGQQFSGKAETLGHHHRAVFESSILIDLAKPVIVRSIKGLVIKEQIIDRDR